MEQAKNLFLFVPSENWTYCGGATLICADTAEEAVYIGNVTVKEDKRKWDAGWRDSFIIAEHAPFSMEEGKDNYIYEHRWVLVNKFVLAEPLNIGVIFSDANCG